MKKKKLKKKTKKKKTKEKTTKKTKKTKKWSLVVVLDQGQEQIAFQQAAKVSLRMLP